MAVAFVGNGATLSASLVAPTNVGFVTPAPIPGTDLVNSTGVAIQEGDILIAPMGLSFNPVGSINGTIPANYPIGENSTLGIAPVKSWFATWRAADGLSDFVTADGGAPRYTGGGAGTTLDVAIHRFVARGFDVPMLAAHGRVGSQVGDLTVPTSIVVAANSYVVSICANLDLAVIPTLVAGQEHGFTARYGNDVANPRVPPRAVADQYFATGGTIALPQWHAKDVGTPARHPSGYLVFTDTPGDFTHEGVMAAF